MTGTVNISRTIFEDAAFKSEPFTEREAFIWMIMEARYSCEPKERRVGGAVVTVGRGQFAASVRFMAEAWGWTKSRVDRYLKRAAGMKLVCVESGTGVNLITICEYEDSQNAPKSAGQQRDSSGTAAGQQRDKPNTGVIQGKDSEIHLGAPKGASRSAAKGSRLPKDWTPSDSEVQFAINEGFVHDEIRRAVDEFRDYWVGVSGAKGVKRDWPATWRNWVRRKVGDRGKRGARNAGPRGPHKTLFDAAAKAAARHEGGA